MSTKLLPLGAVLSAACLLAGPGSTSAAPHGGGGSRGGGGGGGFHGSPGGSRGGTGGYHGAPAYHGGYGGYHAGYGGYHPGYGAYHNGYGVYRSAYYPGYANNRFRYYPSVAIGLGFGGFGGYGGYLGYNYDAPAYGGYLGYNYDAPAYGPGPDYSNGPRVPAVQGDDSGRDQPPRDDAAHILLMVPADAEVWFNGVKTKQTGTEREFQSPELVPGKDYTYEVRVRWRENGQEKDRTRTLTVHANDWLRIDPTR